MQPFFTIGVPTYNRHDLLRETLNSILSQGFTDFEVLVGNDYTAEVLTGEALGISDPRVRFVNHPQNLREVGNMNALLHLAAGRYFTWIFDDDLYEPGFLQTAHDCLSETGFPPAFFSSFRMLQDGEEYRPRTLSGSGAALVTGRKFLGGYSAKAPRIASTCGVFETKALREVVGGVEELCDSAIGVYCEYLFLVRCALLERIVYLDAPFYVFRIHPDSWSESPSEYEKYLRAGKELVRRSADVLRDPRLLPDFDRNLMMICEQHLITIAHRSARLEKTGKSYGMLAAWRSLSRYREEAREIAELFAGERGEGGWGARVRFLIANLNCYRIVVLNLASFFYRSLKMRSS